MIYVVTYAKTLVPGPVPTPMLVVTTLEAAVLMPQLLGHGWAWFGDPFPEDAIGQLAVTHERLALDVDGQVLLILNQTGPVTDLRSRKPPDSPPRSPTKQTGPPQHCRR